MWKFRLGPRCEADIVLLVLLGLYCVLLVQYFHNRSLWMDEAMLSLNIINKNPSDLLRPLDYWQAAPILFLLVEKFFVVQFGSSELVLRIFPLLCALCSLPLFYLLCHTLTRSSKFSLYAMILLGLSPSFVYFSTEVKQYMVDLFVSLVLYNIAFVPLPFWSRRRGLMLSVVGAIAIFLSNVAVIPLTVIGLFYTYQIWKTRRISAGRLIPMVVWVAFFLVNFFLFIYHHPHTAYMKNFWRRSFMPLNPFSVSFVTFIAKGGKQIFDDLLPSLPLQYLFVTSALVYACGLVFMLLKKDFLLLYLCVAPLIIHLALSALKLYPFELRMLLYEAPLFVLVLMYGIWNLTHYFAERARIRNIILASAVALVTFKLFLQFPINRCEMRPALAYINKMKRPGETLYVFWENIPTTRYYMQNGLAGIDSLSVRWGSPRLGRSEGFPEDIRTINGPTWLLITNVYPSYGDKTDGKEAIQMLTKRGRLMQHTEYVGCVLYQFDLH